jgi:hypothetical protein
MKLFLALLVLVGSYVYVLLHTTNLVLGQTQRLSQTYQYIAKHSDHPGDYLTDQLATSR